jgi:hypothetical protein
VPGPTLAENELLEVLLEAEEFDRDENVDESDELRPGPAFAVALIAGVTILDEGGAGWFFLKGSPAVSTNVLLFGAGSGTAHELSED